jgi:3-mercaptopyruvate sulfurtransferase SseA
MNEHTSARAVLDMNGKGIKNTAALLGGWNGWKSAGLPVEGSAAAPPATPKKN